MKALKKFACAFFNVLIETDPDEVARAYLSNFVMVTSVIAIWTLIFAKLLSIACSKPFFAAAALATVLFALIFLRGVILICVKVRQERI